MKGSNKKTALPASNQTSSLARELMTRTLERLALADKDEDLAEEMKQRRQEQLAQRKGRTK